jgi:hypothetical protein
MDRLAVFVLSTVRSNGKFQQLIPNYFESRILPIINTWGLLIPNLFFLFGTNIFDTNFLQVRCNIISKRKLTPHTPQSPLVNILEKYKCPIKQYEGLHWIYNASNYIGKKKDTNILYSFNVIRMSNCTGEYFGR